MLFYPYLLPAGLVSLLASSMPIRPREAALLVKRAPLPAPGGNCSKMPMTEIEPNDLYLQGGGEGVSEISDGIDLDQVQRDHDAFAMRMMADHRRQEQEERRQQREADFPAKRAGELKALRRMNREIRDLEGIPGIRDDIDSARASSVMDDDYRRRMRGQRDRYAGQWEEDRQTSRETASARRFVRKLRADKVEPWRRLRSEAFQMYQASYDYHVSKLHHLLRLELEGQVYVDLEEEEEVATVGWDASSSSSKLRIQDLIESEGLAAWRELNHLQMTYSTLVSSRDYLRASMAQEDEQRERDGYAPFGEGEGHESNPSSPSASTSS